VTISIHGRSDIFAVSDVVSQHAEGATFLWRLRLDSANQPHFKLLDIAHLDHRVEAHIDGLRVAGEEGWQLARKEMAWKQAGEVFAAAVLAFESADHRKIDEVLRVGSVTPELARGVISALGWMEYSLAEPHIHKLCTAELRTHRRIGIASAAIHRKDPGRALNAALSSGDPLLRARAARAVGELGRTDLVPYLQEDLRAKDAGCRLWAAWSSALLVGYANSIQMLQSFVEVPGPFRERALQLALRRLNLSSAHAWHRRLCDQAQSLRVATIGAGVLGDPVLIPWLMEQMLVPPLARVAGEAFTMITGVDIAYHDLNRKKPEDFEAGPNEDPQDDNVEMDPDEKLPWPDVALIAAWWNKHHDELQAGVRHLLGKPISVEWAENALRVGQQRQRAAAALELAILRPGSVLFEVRAPGFRQQRILKHSTYR
jgi:uncharacterized protein (TIGR02270 family)